MKIEHKLTDTQREFIAQTVQIINQLAVQYHNALGQAAELRPELDAARASLGHVIGLIQRTERLPASGRPYSLSPDGSALVGETADQASPIAAAPASAEVAAAMGGKVNGLSA